MYSTQPVFLEVSLNMVILITGPKHSGKTLCAKALAKIIKAETVDLDELIEKETGQTPRELYKESPEKFKKAEARALASLINPPNPPECLVIAAGGGLIDNSEALALLTEPFVPPGRGEIITVYLEVSPETAWQRILYTAAGGELPPFLNTENPAGNPEETHLVLHKRRAKAYKALAQLTINAENKTPEKIAGEIAGSLGINSK